MQSNPHKLTVIDGETLMDKRLPPTKFCIDTLLPQGLCILGGSPKVGKSWLVLDLCVHVAQGSPMWGLDVTKGDVLYLCLEDSERRIQERLNTVTDNVPEGMYFATGAPQLRAESAIGSVSSKGNTRHSLWSPSTPSSLSARPLPRSPTAVTTPSFVSSRSLPTSSASAFYSSTICER